MRYEIKTVNIWNVHDLIIGGKGEEHKVCAFLQYVAKCLKWSIQRITQGYCDMDTANIYEHLQIIIPSMLRDHKKSRNGSPATFGQEEWDRILDYMILLWQESNEHTCSRKNPYIAEYKKAKIFFHAKYGYSTAPDAVPEYKKIEDQYYAEEKMLEQYRMACNDEALVMLRQYYYYLCD